MKQLLELLRLHCELKFSQRDIAKMINISKTTVHNYTQRKSFYEICDTIIQFLKFKSK
jgi:predicted transcriptional regulator